MARSSTSFGRLRGRRGARACVNCPTSARRFAPSRSCATRRVRMRAARESTRPKAPHCSPPPLSSRAGTSTSREVQRGAPLHHAPRRPPPPPHTHTNARPRRLSASVCAQARLSYAGGSRATRRASRATPPTTATWLRGTGGSSNASRRLARARASTSSLSGGRRPTMSPTPARRTRPPRRRSFGARRSHSPTVARPRRVSRSSIARPRSI